MLQIFKDDVVDKLYGDFGEELYGDVGDMLYRDVAVKVKWKCCR